ncbi:MAG: hypothetical protein M5R36_16220 [Deltaproteobacteria bacterium]|nr:hypothetical protein [Deltaproteobacteria bacterium]
MDVIDVVGDVRGEQTELVRVVLGIAVGKKSNPVAVEPEMAPP